MYYGCGIAPLSQKQVSRILNGHPVRVALGKAHKIALSSEHAKKLHRAGLKGKGMTVTLDPYAIMHNQHLREDVGMKGRGATSEGLKSNAGDNAGRLMTGMTDRALKGIAGGAVSEGLKANAGDNAGRLMTGMTDRALKGIAGNGMKGCGRQGKALKASASQNTINLMTAAVDRGIKGIVGNGMKGCGKKSTPEHIREYTKAIGQVFLPLNRGAAGAAKRQLIDAAARAGEAYIENEVPGAQYQRSAPTAGETRMGKRQSRPPPPRAPRDESFEYEMPTATPIVYEGQRMDLADLPMPPTGFPKARLYASGLKRNVKRASNGQFGGAFRNAGY